MQTQIPMTILTCAVFLAAGLAGCLGTDDGGDTLETSGPTTSASTSPTATATASPSPSPSPSDAPEPPVAGLDADVAAGPTPLQVNFTLTNEGGTAAAWTLVSTLGENETEIASGTDLPADVNHTFEAAGNHSVVLTVEGVDGLEDQATVTITVDAAQVAAGSALTYHFSGTVEQEVVLATAASKNHEFEVPAGATEVVVKLRWSDVLTWPTANDFDLYLYDGNGDEVDGTERAAGFETLRVDAAEWAAGTWTAEVSPFVVPLADYSLDVAVLMGTPGAQTFTETTTAEAVPDITGVVGVPRNSHTVAIPDGTTFVMGTLTWQSAPSAGAVTYCSTVSEYTTDLDLYAYNPAGSEEFHSYDFGTCELGWVNAGDGDALPAGEWTFDVGLFLGPEAEYTLTVEYL